MTPPSQSPILFPWSADGGRRRDIQSRQLRVTMKTLLSERQLRLGVEQLAREIDQHYGAQPLTVIAVMTGSIVLFADLIRMLSMPLRVGVVQASSYRGGTVAGELTVDKRMMIDVQGRDVMLVDDIFDTGQTLQRLMDEIGEMGAASVRSAVLLQKKRCHDVAVRPDFVAFEIPDEFVVGYGLDFQDHYRNLPFLGVLEDSDFEQIKH